MGSRSGWTIALCLLAAAGCGDDAAPSRDGGTSSPDVNISVCGAIGTSCSDECPSGLTCINDACMPVRGDCGGIVGTACFDPAWICTYPAGNSGGICMEPDEKACACATAPNALGDC